VRTGTIRNNAVASVSFCFRLLGEANPSPCLFPWRHAKIFKRLQRILEACCWLSSADFPSKNQPDYLLNGDTWTYSLLRCFLSFLSVYRQGCRHDDITLAGIKNFGAKRSLLLIGYGDTPGAYNGCRFNRLELQANGFVSEPVPRVKHFVKQVIGR